MSKGEFASKFEKRIWDILQKAKVNARYEPESFVYHKRTRQTYCTECGSKDTYKIASYTPDFKIGRGIYIEAKGFLKPAMRTAMEDFKAYRPDFDLRFVFQIDNWMTRKKKHKYSDWAKKHGFKYAIQEIPKEWIKEASQQIANRGSAL